MNLTFSGRNFNLTDDIMDRAEKKLNQRVSRLFPDNAEVHTVFSAIRQDVRAEITVRLRNRTLRAEVAAKDAISAVDQAADSLERQMVKYKKRVKDRSRRDAAFKDEVLAFVDLPEAADIEQDAPEGITIEKTKRFALKPMDPEEAVMSMEMLGHVFYVFRNSLNDEVNVVYKRENGSYGLIDPSN